MGIDKETSPNWVNIVIDDNKEYLDELREQATEDGQNDGADPKKLSLTLDKGSFEMGEYYYDEKENEILISGEVKSSKGMSYIGINIPLSDIVMIDIINGAIKKLNKLKTALEALN